MMTTKTIYIIFLLTLSHVMVQGQVDSTFYKRVETIVGEAQKQFAPDKRTALVEIKHADVLTNRYHVQTTSKDAAKFVKNQLAAKSAEVKVSLFPDSSVLAKPHGVVNLSLANLRTMPRHSAELATQLIMGTAVDILDLQSGDYRIRTPEGYIAWVPQYSITAMDEAEFKAWKEKDKIIYTKEFGNAYSSVDADSLRVSDLIYGNILALNGTTDNYYHVSYPDGRQAFVRKDEATLFKDWLKSRQLSRENLIRSAKTMMGLPYLWGGTSVRGVDCSGFTKTAFYMNGYIIPRDASQQVLAGDNVDIMNAAGDFDEQIALEKLLPGDLLFFAASKGKNENPRVTHVAIYIGNGEFIHAAGAVRINSFLANRDNYDDFQTRTVVGAKRYIGSEDPLIQLIAQSNYY